MPMLYFLIFKKRNIKTIERLLLHLKITQQAQEQTNSLQFSVMNHCKITLQAFYQIGNLHLLPLLLACREGKFQRQILVMNESPASMKFLNDNRLRPTCIQHTLSKAISVCICNIYILEPSYIITSSPTTISIN